MLKAGSKAPNFSLETDEGKKVSLKDFAGKKVVLYFYPKDDTPGCTKEACSFTENIGAIKKSGAVVLGVSADSVESHKKFKNKYSLTFPLLSDPNRETIQKYGVWKEKNMYGKKMMGVERTTFVIDEEGKIAHIFPKVKVDGHTEKVLEKLKSSIRSS
jgi:thioredoxin-dependent peroxiredoxin